MIDSIPTVIGYLNDGKMLTIPYDTRQNMVILGEIGSGKSSILRLMILQDIQAKRGFMIIENHTELSREILSMIPKDQRDKIVYVNLQSLRLFEKTLRFNPLECADPHDAGMIALNFTECMAKAFADSWGARVETCTRNGALGVIGTSSNTLGVMLKLLTDEDFRAAFIPNIKNKHSRDFFITIYDKQYPKEAGGVVFNKLNKMMTIPEMDAMFNTSKSSISFKEIIDNGMYVILDFGGGIPDDMVKFLGNIFLHLFYTNYRKRAKNIHGTYDSFNIYLDEVQTFSAPMVRQILNTVRKYGMKATIATQSISALDKDLADEIATLCRAVACFRCDVKTAHHLKSILPVSVEEQQKLSWHTFSFYSGGINPIQAVAQTKHLPIYDVWHDAAKHSVERLGAFVSLEKYYTQNGGNADVLLSPLEFGILNYLRMENRDISYNDIIQKMQRRYSVDIRGISSALHDTLIGSNHYIVKKDIRSNDGDANLTSRYVITESAIKMVFSKAAAGRRAGGPLHLAAIYMIMDVQCNLGNYCIPDLGDGAASHADLLIFNPKKVSTDDGLTLLHPFEWSEKSIAVEVETAPGKHGSQVLKNFHKNTDMGYFVWFVVFDVKHKEYINNICDGDNISPAEYSIYILDQDSLADNVDVDYTTVRVTTELHAVIFNILMNSGGRAAESYICDNAYNYDMQSVKDALISLGNKGDIAQKLIQEPNSERMIPVWELSGLSKSKKIIPGIVDSDQNIDESEDISDDIPEDIILSPNTNDKTDHPNTNDKTDHPDTNNYSIMSDDLLLAIHQTNSENENEQLKIVDVLKSRKLIIKKRGNSTFLSKIPSADED